MEFGKEVSQSVREKTRSQSGVKRAEGTMLYGDRCRMIPEERKTMKLYYVRLQ